MIWTVFATHVRRLLHNRVELLLTFVVPVMFFSIFAMIFARGVGTTPRVTVVVVDEAGTPHSVRLAQSVSENPGLRSMSDKDPKRWTRGEAEQMVRRGGVSMAVVLRQENDHLVADLLADASDQVAGQVVSAIVTRSLAVESARVSIERRGSVAHSEVAPASYAEPVPDSHPLPDQDSYPLPDQEASFVRLVDVMGGTKTNSVISMYAAGIAVMFLLFGATTGGGVLLEEKESQTLERLLSTRLTMDQLLLGKWFYLTVTGCLQVSVMFLWGQSVFGVDLFGHLDGFLMMTLVTASAAAAFGLLLATLCRTRGQLNALSVIVVLTMSALGGSMVPRYVMSPELRQAGLWTFNAWALDGYDKVFWRELPVAELSPQLAVLVSCGFVFLILARLLATRWETQ